ncbi:MAG TPA: PqqD family peptide modification chaperone [Thermoanaerobaculia bacterium]|jgi:MoaA/NifB/PqqE/SkfB family radical SAM enzyme
MTSWIQETELSYRLIAGEAVIVNRIDNTLHRLNEVGATVFEALGSPAGLDDVLQTVRSRFDFSDVPAEEVESDVRAFVDDLLARRLIRDAGSAPAPRGLLRLDPWRDELERIGVDLVAPVWSKIEVSTRCHLDCVHCYIPFEERHLPAPPERRDLDNAEICALIDELAGIGALLLTLTGGEIFIRSGIFDVLEHAQRRNFILELFTTGMPLNADKVARLAAMNVGRVQISLYSHEAATHDAVTQAPGSWQRSVSAARQLAQAGVHIDFACTLMQSNVGDTEGMKRLAESIGATVSYGYPITARTDGNRDTHALRTTGPELEQAIRALPEFFAMPKPKSAAERICPAAVNMCAVSASGDVLPCSQFHLPLGNVRETPLAEIWERSPVARRVRAIRTGDLKPSAHGALDAYVGLCPGLNLLEEGDPLVPARVTAETTLAVSRVLGSSAAPR